MILDSRGNQVEARKPRELTRDDRCPECGADKENIKPVLGGSVVCMKCGYQSKEARERE